MYQTFYENSTRLHLAYTQPFSKIESYLSQQLMYSPAAAAAAAVGGGGGGGGRGGGCKVALNLFFNIYQ